MDEQKTNIDDLVNIIPLNKDISDVTQKIIEENDVDRLKNLTSLFNVNQAKKNALRVIKLNSLLDKVSDEMIARFEKHPGEFSNADLLNYLQVTQSAIDRANKSLGLIDEASPIQFNQVNVNVKTDELDRESKEKVADAIKAIMNRLGKLPKEEDSTVSLIQDNNEDAIIIDDSNQQSNLLNGEEE